MSSPTRSMARRLVALALAVPLFGAAVMVSWLAASPVGAASTLTTMTPIEGTGQQISGTFNGRSLNNRWAGTLRVQINGANAFAYCIDLTRPIAGGLTLQEKDWPAAIEGTLTNGDLDKIARIMANNFPNVVPPGFELIGSANDRAAAVQAAIWYFSDEFRLNPTAAQGDLKTNYDRILSFVDGVAPDYPPFGGTTTAPSLEITPNNLVVTTGQVAGPYVVNTTGTAALEVSDAEIVNQDGTPWTGNRNAVTNGTRFWLKKAATGTATVNARANATIGTGRVFISYNAQGQINAQKVILATPTAATVSDTSTATVVPPSQVQVTKVAEGITTVTPFTFTLTGPGLPAGGTKIVVRTNGPAVTSSLVGPLLSGEKYTITEDSETGFSQQAGSCSGAAEATAQGRAVTFTVPASGGATIQCTFSNSRLGRIVVAKQTTPARLNQDFTVTLTSASGAVARGVINAGSNPPKTAVFDNLAPGTYTVAEASPPNGWIAGAVTCSQESGAVNSAAKAAGGDVKSAAATTAKKATPTTAKSGNGKVSAGVVTPTDTPNQIELTPGANYSCLISNVRNQPGITVVKVPSNSSPLVGSTVTYTFTVTNTGDVPLTNINLIDAGGDIQLGQIRLAKTSLAPGESTTGTATYVVLPSQAGQNVVNRATVTGQPPSGPPVTDRTEARIIPVQVLPTTVPPPGGPGLPRTGGSSSQILGTLGLGIVGMGVLMYGYGQTRPKHLRRRR